MIQLRKATIEDLSLLEYWDQQQHVIDADPNDDWNWAYELTRDPDWREQLIATLNGDPIGVIQIIDPALEETNYWGKVDPGKRAIDIWIGEADHLGKGYGSQMMKLALGRCFATPDVMEVLIDPLKSNVKAIRFYQSIGFEFLEERVFGQDLCEVHVFRRTDWEKLS